MHNSSALAISFIFLLASAAQTNAQFATVINVPADPAPSAIGSDTQLNLHLGGSLPGIFEIGDPSGAGSNTELNFYGGTSVNGARARSGSTVNLNDGYLTYFVAMAGSKVNVNGGFIGPSFEAQAGSQVRVTGGEVETGFRLRSGGTLDLTGGVIKGFVSEAGTVVKMSGGQAGNTSAAVVRGQMEVTGGAINQLSIDSTSQVKLRGADFRINGIPVAGLLNPGDTTSVNVPDASVISGVLEDGVPFVFAALAGDNLALGSLTLEQGLLLPHVPMTIHSSTDSVPLGIHNLQTLIVDASNTVPNDYIAGVGSRIVVKDGAIGPGGLKAVGAFIEVDDGQLGGVYAFDGTELLVRSGSSINTSIFKNSSVKLAGGHASLLYSDGGSVGITDGGSVDRLRARPGTEIDLYDGLIGVPNSGSVQEILQVYDSSILNMFGGQLGFNSRIFRGGTANIRGGSLGSFFTVDEGAIARFYGGTLGQGIYAARGSTISFVGQDFMLDGVPIGGISPGAEFLLTARNQTLSGILADGSAFSLPLSGRINAASTITLTLSMDSPMQLRGDYDLNGQVDGNDLLLWQQALGSANLAADGNANGIVDSGDLEIWKIHVGEGVSSPVTVPEPNSAMAGLLYFLATHSLVWRGRKRQSYTPPSELSVGEFALRSVKTGMAAIVLL